MDGFSGAAAAVSLAVQLASTVQSIRQFLHNIEHASQELSAITARLDLLHELLTMVESLMQEQPYLRSPPATHVLIDCALENCSNSVKILKALVKPLEEGLVRRSRFQKTLGLMKVMLKREDIQTSEHQLQGAIQMLHVAISVDQYECSQNRRCV